MWDLYIKFNSITECYNSFLVVYDCDLNMLNADTDSTVIKDILITLGEPLTFSLGNTNLDVCVLSILFE